MFNEIKMLSNRISIKKMLSDRVLIDEQINRINFSKKINKRQYLYLLKKHFPIGYTSYSNYFACEKYKNNIISEIENYKSDMISFYNKMIEDDRLYYSVSVRITFDVFNEYLKEKRLI